MCQGWEGVSEWAGVSGVGRCIRGRQGCPGWVVYQGWVGIRDGQLCQGWEGVSGMGRCVRGG